MPDQDASDSELRRRGLEHASANAGVETTCTCEGPYRNLRHDQPCCRRNAYLPCKHEIKDLADMGAGTANMCNLDRSGQRLVRFECVSVTRREYQTSLIIQCRVLPSW